MATLHARPAGGELAGRADPPLEASDDLASPAHPRYCPTTLLASFALLMAGHGRCVKTDMMLGDREYAMWQLACARALEDDELAQVTTQLFAYFDDPQHTAQAVLGTA